MMIYRSAKECFNSRPDYLSGLLLHQYQPGHLCLENSALGKDCFQLEFPWKPLVRSVFRRWKLTISYVIDTSWGWWVWMGLLDQKQDFHWYPQLPLHLRHPHPLPHLQPSHLGKKYFNIYTFRNPILVSFDQKIKLLQYWQLRFMGLILNFDCKVSFQRYPGCIASTGRKLEIKLTKNRFGVEIFKY